MCPDSNEFRIYLHSHPNIDCARCRWCNCTRTPVRRTPADDCSPSSWCGTGNRTPCARRRRPAPVRVAWTDRSPDRTPNVGRSAAAFRCSSVGIPAATMNSNRCSATDACTLAHSVRADRWWATDRRVTPPLGIRCSRPKRRPRRWRYVRRLCPSCGLFVQNGKIRIWLFRNNVHVFPCEMDANTHSALALFPPYYPDQWWPYRSSWTPYRPFWTFCVASPRESEVGINIHELAKPAYPNKNTNHALTFRSRAYIVHDVISTLWHSTTTNRSCAFQPPHIVDSNNDHYCG